MQRLRTWLRFFLTVQLLPALEGGEETLVGGQAVLEGVMMRSPHAWGIACRKSSGEITTHSETIERPSEKHKWMAWPILRGIMTLGYAMKLGYRRAAIFDHTVSAGMNSATGSGSRRQEKEEI